MDCSTEKGNKAPLCQQFFTQNRQKTDFLCVILRSITQMASPSIPTKEKEKSQYCKGVRVMYYED